MAYNEYAHGKPLMGLQGCYGSKENQVRGDISGGRTDNVTWSGFGTRRIEAFVRCLPIKHTGMPRDGRDTTLDLFLPR